MKTLREQQANNDGPTNVPGQPLPLTETTNEAQTAEKGAEGTTTVEPTKDSKPRAPRQPKQRGPPEDGIPSKNKVMVANLPYELSEEKVRSSIGTKRCVPLTWIS